MPYPVLNIEEVKNIVGGAIIVPETTIPPIDVIMHYISENGYTLATTSSV